jgi:hypothetical protein
MNETTPGTDTMLNVRRGRQRKLYFTKERRGKDGKYNMCFVISVEESNAIIFPFWRKNKRASRG